MPVSSLWQESFKHGVSLYKNEKYEDAIEYFSKAIAANSNDRQLYDSRASSFEKLERYKEALKDAKRVIDLAPKSWQGYARSARLFLRVNKPEAALKMADMAIERVKLTDSKRRSELALLRGLAQTAIANSACHFQKLPIELITSIFSNVIGGSNTVMLRLTSVCRFWRELIIGTPALWCRITISKKSKQKKVDAWLERSKGRLNVLHLTDTFDLEARPNTFRHAPPSMWANLRELHLNRDHGRHRDTMPLPDGVVSSLKLKVLCVSVQNTTESDTFGLPPILDVSMLEDFSFFTAVEIPSIPSTKFSSLKRLSLTGRDIKLDRLLGLLPYPENLEHLAIHDVRRPYGLLNVDDLGRFVRLVRLELSGLVLEGQWSTLTDLPLLTDVTLIEGIDRTDLRDDHEIVSLKWESLRFRYFVLSYDNLIATLKKANVLSSLGVVGGHTDTIFGQNLKDTSILELLAGQGDLACPRLQHFHWSCSLTTRARDLVRVVKARLPVMDDTTLLECQEDAPLDHPERPLPLKTLIIEDCPNVDPEALPWLRANVPTFSCRRKKEEKRRRM